MTQSTQIHIRNIALDLVFTILTFGFYNLWVQHKQIQAVNVMLGHQKYTFLKWFLFTFLTCGIYHIIHEYMKSEDILKVLGDKQGTSSIVVLILCLFGLPIIADALQQIEINQIFEEGLEKRFLLSAQIPR